MVETIRFAIATDDGDTISTEHFGSAKFYLVYSISLGGKEPTFLKKVINTSKEEEHHGDPEKAKEVAALFKDIPVLVGFAMGLNITRMRKKFVPVISRERDIQKTLELIKKALPEINNSLNADGEKKIVYLTG